MDWGGPSAVSEWHRMTKIYALITNDPLPHQPQYNGDFKSTLTQIIA
jgi:hypothetical protein